MRKNFLKRTLAGVLSAVTLCSSMAVSVPTAFAAEEDNKASAIEIKVGETYNVADKGVSKAWFQQNGAPRNVWPMFTKASDGTEIRAYCADHAKGNPGTGGKPYTVTGQVKDMRVYGVVVKSDSRNTLNTFISGSKVLNAGNFTADMYFSASQAAIWCALGDAQIAANSKFGITYPSSTSLGYRSSGKTLSAYELECMRHAGKIHAKVLETVAPALLRPGLSEARLCSEICTSMLDHGAMGISRYNQPVAEDVLGFASYSENSLMPAALDGPSGTVGTCIAMKSIGSTERLLRGGDTVLLDIPCGWRGYHTDKSITFYFGDLDENPKADLIRAAHEQCIALEKMTAELLRPGAVPAEIYEKVLAAVDPVFRDGFMNSCKFLGHSIGLTMDEAPVLAKGFNDPVVPGMTFAVEPKIALEGIGLIGTENTYAVTEGSAAKSLTGDCETGLEINY